MSSRPNLKVSRLCDHENFRRLPLKNFKATGTQLGHFSNYLFEGLNPQVSVQFSRLRYVDQEALSEGIGNAPKHRWFYIIGHEGKDGGHIRLENAKASDKAITLKAKHSYFINQSLVMNVHFKPGLKMLAVHFSIDIENMGTLTSSHQKIVERKEEDGEALEALVTRLDRFERLDELLELKSRLTLPLTKYFDDDLEHFRKDVQQKKKYEAFFKYLKEHLKFGINNNEISDLMGVSKSTLTRDFKKYFGTTVKDYINNLILIQSQEMLLYSDESVKVIAEKLGFNNEFYFSHFFKKLTGKSPSEYRAVKR